MFSTKGVVCYLSVAAAVISTISASADETGDAARAVLDAWAESVVTVRLVVKERWIYEGSEDSPSEYASEITGFVVAPDGTVATSLSATDPEVFYSQWLDEDDAFQVRTEISSLTIIGEDGAEQSANVILRDRDLDLIFIRAKTAPDAAARPVPLDSRETARAFEQVVQLTRFDHTLKRTCGGKLRRIEGFVEKPRRLYAIDSDEGSLGSPIFTLDGKLLGMTALRQLNKSASGERGMWSNVDDFTIVVVPTEDIAEAVAQLPAR